MSIHDKLWKKLPEVLCFIVRDDDGFSGFCYRPTFDKKENKWVSANAEQFDWLDINGISLPRPFQRLRRLPSDAAIFQRPSSWDGELREGDVVRLNKKSQVYVVNGFFNDEKPWLEDAITRDMTMTSWARIATVNGIAVKDQILKHKQSVSRPGLPPEVHNHSDVDGDKAMAIVRSMCRGYAISG
ncbi:hypothetical protein N9V90_02215 [Endozoicomonas sp.]|nr:hypothetical protein [Endozoicomonas sp.]